MSYYYSAPASNVAVFNLFKQEIERINLAASDHSPVELQVQAMAEFQVQPVQPVPVDPVDPQDHIMIRLCQITGERSHLHPTPKQCY